MISLDKIFQWNNVLPPDEILEDNCMMLKSMYNSEPVINLFSLFDKRFNLLESKAFIDLYSTCHELPVNIIFDYFLDCHIQYIYLVHIRKDIYYLFMYNFDSAPVTPSRDKLCCFAYVVRINRYEFVRNIMQLKVYGFDLLKSFVLNDRHFDSFKNSLYFCTNELAKKYHPLKLLYDRIIDDANIPLTDLCDHSVYIKKDPL